MASNEKERIAAIDDFIKREIDPPPEGDTPSLVTSQEGDVTVVRINLAKLSTLTVDSIQPYLEDIINHAGSRVVLDLGDVSYVGSAAVGLLFQADLLARKSGKTFSIRNVGPLIRQTLRSFPFLLEDATSTVSALSEMFKKPTT